MNFVYLVISTAASKHPLEREQKLTCEVVNAFVAVTGFFESTTWDILASKCSF